MTRRRLSCRFRAEQDGGDNPSCYHSPNACPKPPALVGRRTFLRLLGLTNLRDCERFTCRRRGRRNVGCGHRRLRRFGRARQRGTRLGVGLRRLAAVASRRGLQSINSLFDIIGEVRRYFLLFAQVLLKAKDSLILLPVLLVAPALVEDIGCVAGIEIEVSQDLNALLGISQHARPLGLAFSGINTSSPRTPCRRQDNTAGEQDFPAIHSSGPLQVNAGRNVRQPGVAKDLSCSAILARGFARAKPS